MRNGLKNTRTQSMIQRRMLVAVCLLTILTGCGGAGGSAHTGDQTSAVDQVLSERAAETDALTASSVTDAAVQSVSENEEEVDPQVLALVRDIAAEAGIEDPDLSGSAQDDSSDLTDWRQMDPAAGDETAMAVMPPDCDVDVDLTILNSAMVYSEVYNMMMYPEKYIGKSVRMRGSYSVYQDETTGRIYLACFISDAAACCQQGIEFEPENMADMKYPDDYPEIGDDLTIAGVYDIYDEEGTTYCTLRNAVIEENRGSSF